MLHLRKLNYRHAKSYYYYSQCANPSAKLLSSHDVRRIFLDYFIKNDHDFVRSSPVMPYCDATVPFVNAGMIQFKNIFLNKTTPKWKRVANSQKCVRVGGKHNDLSVVGTDGYHHTFFEMLGNWSFGDYHKEQACTLAWNLLTGPYGIHPSRMYVTYFAGDSSLGLEADLECLEVWRKLGLPNERILPFGMKENFWEMGAIGPTGPCSEIHIDHQPNSNPVDRARFVNVGRPDLTELWNIVFMEYSRNSDKSISPLPQKHIDTGMGFERLLAVLQGKSCNYETDLFIPIFQSISKATNLPEYRGSYDPNSDSYKLDVAYRVLADHARMITVCIADGIYPNFSNRLRRIVRKTLAICENTFQMPTLLESVIVPVVVEILGGTYTELERNYEQVVQVIAHERELYRESLQRQEEELSKIELSNLTIEDVIDYPGFAAAYRSLEQHHDDTPNLQILTGEFMYELHKQHGLDEDILVRLAESKDLAADVDSFREIVEIEKAKYKTTMAQQAAFETSKFEKFATLPPTDNSLKYNYTYDASSHRYNIPKTTAKVLAIEKDLWSGNVYHIVLDRSNFYYPAGGQEGDQGKIKCNETIFHVDQVANSNNGVVVHTGRFFNGLLRPGDEVTLTVDADKRTETTRHHTATHLLHAALKKITNHITYQLSSNVEAERLQIEFGIIGSMPSDTDIAAIERCVRDSITAATPVQRVLMTPHDLYACDKVTLIPGMVYPEEGIIILKIESNGLASLEPCCGTHATNTQELQSFCITSIKSTGNRGFRVEAVTGSKAFELLKNGEKLNRKIKQVEDEKENSSVLDDLRKLEDKVESFVNELEKNVGESLPYSARSKGLLHLHLILSQIRSKIGVLELRKRQEERLHTKTDPEVEHFIDILLKSMPSEIDRAYQQLSESTLLAVVEKLQASGRLVNLFDALGEASNLDGVEKVNSLWPNAKWHASSRAKACALSGRASQWLDEWHSKLDEIDVVGDLRESMRYFNDGFSSLVAHNLQLITKCEHLARRLAEKGVLRPISTIWCHHIILGNNEFAQKIWKEYIQNSTDIDFRPISNKAKYENDDISVLKLIDYLETSDCGKIHLDGLYTVLLGVYVRKNQLDEALKIFEMLTNRECTINRKILKTLKDALKTAGKQLPSEKR